MTALAEQTLWGLLDQPVGRDDHAELARLRGARPYLGFLRLPGGRWVAIGGGRYLWAASAAELRQRLGIPEQ